MKRIKGFVLVLSALALMLGFAPVKPAQAASNTESFNVGMPFKGRWAYNTSYPYDDYLRNDDNASHPKIHDLSSSTGSDWAVDVHPEPAAGATKAGTVVKLKINNATGKLTFKRVSSWNSGCGKGIKFNVFVDGKEVGELGYAHLDEASANTSGALSNGVTLGKVAGCQPYPHIHIEVGNRINHACYKDYGRPGAKVLAMGATLGTLGSDTSKIKTECAASSQPAPPRRPDPIVKSDFNGNGQSDVYWYGPGEAPDAVWFGSVNREVGFAKDYEAMPANGDQVPLSGDFNGDKFSDIFWYGAGDAADSLWYGTSVYGQYEQVSVNVSGVYTPIVGDFNKNGQSDIFWYVPGDGQDKVWYGSSDKVTGFAKGYAARQVSGVYTPISGDFDGDGYGDIFWYGPGDAGDSMWYGKAAHGDFTSVTISVGGQYQPVVGDFDKSGQDDIYWYGPGAAVDKIWYGSYDRSTKFTKNITPEQVEGVYTPIPGDFDGDGYGDIFWYGPGDAVDRLWYGSSSRGNFVGVSVVVPGNYTPI